MAQDVDHAAMDDAVEIIPIAFDTVGIELTALGRVMQLLEQRDMMKERRISHIA